MGRRAMLLSTTAISTLFDEMVPAPFGSRAWIGYDFGQGEPRWIR